LTPVVPELESDVEAGFVGALPEGVGALPEGAGVPVGVPDGDDVGAPVSVGPDGDEVGDPVGESGLLVFQLGMVHAIPDHPTIQVQVHEEVSHIPFPSPQAVVAPDPMGHEEATVAVAQKSPSLPESHSHIGGETTEIQSPSPEHVEDPEQTATEQSAPDQPVVHMHKPEL